MITALIRTHKGREFQVEQAIGSCIRESIGYIVHVDPLGNSEGFSYNLYCNSLKNMVSEGFYFFLDSDDTLIPGALSKIAPHLEEDRPVICQMLRNGRPKPADIYMDKRGVIKGRIGMPCLIVHSKHKDLFTFTATEDADYQWIKTISEQLDCKFIKIPVVDAGQRSNGQ